MKHKFTDGQWFAGCFVRSQKDPNACQCRFIFSDSCSSICTISLWNGIESYLEGNNGCPKLEESIANAVLISAAPALLDALEETDKDLCVLESTMRQIEQRDQLAEGMTALVMKWRERNKQAIKKALEINTL